MAHLDSDAARADVAAISRELESAKARLATLRRQIGRTKGFRRDDRATGDDKETGRLFAWAGRLEEAISAIDVALHELRGIVRRRKS
jgi:hypothetical protein